MAKSKQFLTQAGRHFGNAETELKAIISSANLGSKASRIFNEKLGTATAHMRFSKILSEKETWLHFERLLDELKVATTVVHISSYKDLLSFLSRFSLRHPNPIARSAIYLQLDDRKQKPDQDFPKWVPSSRMIAENFGITLAQFKDISSEAVYFLEQAMIGIQNLVCCLCLNVFRQRRRLKQTVEDWHHLYDHAQTVDQSTEFSKFAEANGIQLQSLGQTSSQNWGPFTVWVEHEGCRIMIRHLFLGFEQDLYQSNEFLYIYWYCEYLLTRMMICEKELFMLWPSGGIPSNKKQAKAHKQAGIIRAQRHSAEIALLELERTLCQGLIRLLLALRVSSIVGLPSLPFNEEQNRFEQRFGVFYLLVKPEFLDFETFRTMTESGQADPSKLLMAATRFFGSAKDQVNKITTQSTGSAVPEETRSRLVQLEKVIKTNNIASNVLEKMISSGAEIKVKFNFEIDKCYPCVSISR